MGAALCARADEADELANSEPRQARAIALEVLQAATRSDAAACATAERVLGQVANLFEELTEARLHLARSIRYAQRVGDRRAEAHARVSRSWALAQDGHFTRAGQELDRAEVVLVGEPQDLGRVHNQRALIAWVRGDYAAAVPHFDRAAAASERTGDRLNLVRVLINRGVVHGRLGDHHAAERDLVRAEQLALSASMSLPVAIARHDLGWVAAQRGDVPTALARYGQAERDYESHLAELGTLLLDRCEVLLGARLVDEAVDAARRALAAFTAGGVATSVPEAQLALAEAQLVAEQPAAAGASAAAALNAFVRQHRPGWAALARYASLRAELGRGSLAPGDARRAALRLAGALDKAGLSEQALDVRVVAARLGLESGHVEAARRELRVAARARHRGTVERRIRAWHAEALLRQTTGDRRGARTALHAGLRILEAHRAMLGATDLRAAASAHRVDLARLGFAMAIDEGRAGEALRWVERSRAGLARMRAVRPPRDDVLAQAMGRLRSTLGEIDGAARSGEPVAALRARQARVERAIRDHCRSLPPGSSTLPAAPPSLAALARRLGSRVLLEFVQHDDAVYAIVFGRGGKRIVDLGPVARVEAATRRLSMLLDRLARDLGGADRRSAMRAELAAQAAALDKLVLVPLAKALGDSELVIAPSAAVRAVPWFVLPSVSGRAISVVPSATVWFEADAAAPATQSATQSATHSATQSATQSVLVAAPGLPAAADEIRGLAGLYPGARVLSGADATVAATMAALDGAGLAHVAAHGSFRADNPLFSSLRLADGPLTVYDLEAIAVAPRTVVLAACESAQHSARPGDELLGLATAFLSLGTRTLLAPLVSLPDGSSVEVMSALHARLRAGTAPAAALAETQLEAADGGPFAAAAGLLCFGRG